MGDNVYKFRRLKWGDPIKLKVLAEDIRATPRIPVYFALTVAAVFVAVFIVTFYLL